jgi:hypothetical protein
MIFCPGCRYYSPTRANIPTRRVSYDTCSHPDNWRRVVNYRGEWFERADSPKKINAGNDCKWFRQRRSLLDWILGRKR